ncbi:hypothetical protein ACN2XU_09085 [Primorskyibacter sp. 2E107]|uniref:hypothetical protein n=1 Tax=Primorskyibacter sp. 2E107 TaxID=3403458 RepID=UPI003AF97717
MNIEKDTTVFDGYDVYFAEKLWDLIPRQYRDMDMADRENPGVLRGFIDALATQAAGVRRSHDRLWEDQMIETAAPWAAPYIGALVGTRMLPQQNLRGQIADVAKTIYYRQRIGTPALLEQLISDIAGWEGVVVEGFTTLARTPHGLDAPRDAMKWAGAADLRHPTLGYTVDGGPFDPLRHTPETAAPKGRRGSHAINRVTFHLFPVAAIRNHAIRPAAIPGAADAYTFDPSGRDVPLFAPRGRAEVTQTATPGADWAAAAPWDLPAPIPCGLLGHERYHLTRAATLALIAGNHITAAQGAALAPLEGRVYEGVSRLRQALLTRPGGAALLANAVLDAIRAETLAPDCGKSALLGVAMSVETGGAAVETPERTSAGDLSDPATIRAQRGLVIDPVRGRFRFAAPPAAEALTVDYHTGHLAALGATGHTRTAPNSPVNEVASGGNWPVQADWPRDGHLQVEDSLTYGQPPDITDIQTLTLSSPSGTRPYARLLNDWTLTALADGNAFLHIDGLWLGAGAPARLVLAGDWEEVRITASTLDPGGAVSRDAGAPVLPPLSLNITGRVETLVIARSLIGQITGTGAIEAIDIADSTLQAQSFAINARDSRLTMQRSTVVSGNIRVQELWISDSVIAGHTHARNLQTGCFRYSATQEPSHVPKPYRAHMLSASETGGTLFRSRRFGDPGYARLQVTAPEAVRRANSERNEMGAFASHRSETRLSSLKQKIEEYAPFGLLPIYRFET